MQFRPQGRRVQVLAYRGYDKEKKRAQVKLLGSFSRYDYSMSDGLLDSLSDDEKTELQSHINNIRQSYEKDTHSYLIKSLATDIKKVSDSLSDETFASLITDQVAEAMFESMDKLAKALRKAGHKRSKPEPKQDASRSGAELL